MMVRRYSGDLRLRAGSCGGARYLQPGDGGSYTHKGGSWSAEGDPPGQSARRSHLPRGIEHSQTLPTKLPLTLPVGDVALWHEHPVITIGKQCIHVLLGFVATLGCLAHLIVVEVQLPLALLVHDRLPGDAGLCALGEGGIRLLVK